MRHSEVAIHETNIFLSNQKLVVKFWILKIQLKRHKGKNENQNFANQISTEKKKAFVRGRDLCGGFLKTTLIPITVFSVIWCQHFLKFIFNSFFEIIP